jgi:glycosyltransferase involved in cell wall biosynthesis
MQDPGARPFLIDVTRSISRVGGGPLTGIDRVERALLRGLLSRGAPLHGLCRTAGGFALLPREGLVRLDGLLFGAETWGRPDLVGRLSLKLPPPRRAAESDVRRLATGHARGAALPALLRERLAPGTVYLNAGHANLAPDVFAAVRAVAGARIGVMIHDVIPLRLPWTQREGATARFREKIDAVARHADVVFCPSAAEAGHVAPSLAAARGAPRIVVAPLGIEIVDPDPEVVLPAAPYFAAVGTIEPRKNIALLLDVWERMAASAPPASLPGLILIGRRGWEEERFFRRLDALGSRLTAISAFPDLPDGARAAIVAGARALLHPSLAEGYGLPPLEALSLGVTPVCAPLPVYRETMGSAGVYADPADLYQWMRVVGDMATSDNDARAECRWKAPGWDGFLNAVLGAFA